VDKMQKGVLTTTRGSYGFIDGQLFCHRSACDDQHIYEGDELYFDETPARDGRLKACNVSLLPVWARDCAFARSWDVWEGEDAVDRVALKDALKAFPTSPDLYLGVLREQDAVGYHAASCVVWRRRGGHVQFLMAYERRKDALALNFLGGKRDSVDERAGETMSREVAEETGGAVRIHDPDTDRVIWCPRSKQVVFVHEFDEDAELPDHPPEVAPETFRQHGAKPEGIVTAVWIGRDRLFARRGTHPWIRAWIRLLGEVPFD